MSTNDRPLTDEALQEMHARNLPKEDFDSHDARPYLPLFEAWVIEIDHCKLTRPLTAGERPNLNHKSLSTAGVFDHSIWDLSFCSFFIWV